LQNVPCLSAVGNRVSLRHGGRESHYRYDAADQLVGSESGGHRTEYSYDSSGSLTGETSGDAHRTIAYNGFGRPVAVTRTLGPLTERAEATFNGDGLLTALVLTSEDPRRDEQRSASANYLWGGFGSVPQIISQRAAPALDDAERDHTERLSADFVYGYGRTFASNEHEGAVFHHDPYGSALRTQDTAAWVQADRYDAFGAPAEEDQDREDTERARVTRLRSPELPRFGYRGELALGDVIDLRARTYDAALGRFTSRDPVIPVTGPSQAANPYAYANNDPLNHTDPLGTLAFAFSAPGDVAAFAEVATAATPTLRVPPAADCPGGPSPATLNQLSAALKQGNFQLISSLLKIPRQYLFAKPPPPPLVPEFVPNNTGGPACGRFGVDCGGKVVMVPKYNNQNTAIPLGFEFWTGFGGRTQYFNQWDPFTQMLMKDPCVQQTLGAIKSTLQCGGLYASTVEYKDPHNVLQVFKDLLGAFTDGRIGSNPADGFLGSYGMAWAAVPTSAHSATVFFTVSNLTDLNSVFHPELLTGGAIRSVDGARPEFAFLLGPIPGGLFTSIGFRPTTQLIQWQETITY
jgi:RHS repeat-associated protein